MIFNQIETLKHSRCATGSNGFGNYVAMSERKQVDSCLEWKKSMMKLSRYVVYLLNKILKKISNIYLQGMFVNRVQVLL